MEYLIFNIYKGTGHHAINACIGTQKVLVVRKRRFHLKYEALKAVEYFKNENPFYFDESLTAFFTQSVQIS
jgi:hypothetical protein